MKKFIALALAAAMCLGVLTASAFAADGEKSVSVYVTIADAGKIAVGRQTAIISSSDGSETPVDAGDFPMAAVTVDVSDEDGDGALTVNDALIAVHDKYYVGGAKAGYAYYTGDYGLAMSKLWGVDNGGSYGYCVNNASAMNLGGEIKSGDYICAYSYADLKTWGDKYAFFSDEFALCGVGLEHSLTLHALGYDDQWNTVIVPVEGAVITVDGKKTKYVTGADGSVSITFDALGSHVISAVKQGETLVPPVCAASVVEPEKLPLSRGDLVLALYEQANSPTVEPKTVFPDVYEGDIYADAVTWAYEMNLVSGYGDGTFGPSDYVTMQQVCVILHKLYAMSGIDVTLRTDVDISEMAGLSDWGTDAVKWAVQEGIVSADTNLSYPLTWADVLAGLPGGEE